MTEAPRSVQVTPQRSVRPGPVRSTTLPSSSGTGARLRVARPRPAPWPTDGSPGKSEAAAQAARLALQRVLGDGDRQRLLERHGERDNDHPGLVVALTAVQDLHLASPVVRIEPVDRLLRRLAAVGTGTTFGIVIDELPLTADHVRLAASQTGRRHIQCARDRQQPRATQVADGRYADREDLPGGRRLPIDVDVIHALGHTRCLDVALRMSGSSESEDS